MTAIVFKFYVDWDNDGDFSESYEDISNYVKEFAMAEGAKQAYQLISDENTLTLTLKNEDKRFSPDNADSPYYGEMLPMRIVEIRRQFESPSAGAVNTELYIGWIDTIDPEGGDGRTATIQCVGTKQALQDQKVRLPLMQDVRTDEVVTAILERAILPMLPKVEVNSGLGEWRLGVEHWGELGETTYLGTVDDHITITSDGLLTLPYFGDNLDANDFDNAPKSERWQMQVNVMNALEDVIRAERGRLSMSQGLVVFYPRSYVQLLTAMVAFGADVLELDNVFIEAPDYSFGADRASTVRVMAYPRTLGPAGAVLWQLGESLVLNQQQERTVRVDYSDEDTNQQIAGLDAAIDTFTHTGHVDITVEFLARGATITLTNRDKFENTVSAIVITGQKLTSYNAVEAVATDEASALFRQIEYTIDSKSQADPDLAQQIAEYELYRRKEPKGAIRSITLLEKDNIWMREVMMGLQFGSSGTVVEVIDDQLVHDGIYYIVGQEHRWGLREGYKVKWILERLDTQVIWRLGAVSASELGETTYLGL